MAQPTLDERGAGEAGGPGSDFELSSAALRSENEALDATLHGLVAKLSGVPGLTGVGEAPASAGGGGSWGTFPTWRT